MSVKGLSESSQDDYARNRMLDDLQLAAELGKTLLERNKELETALKQHQNVIEDQAQEIEYLTKQTVALREVNDSRLRIYEQLEVSIQDLERANHRLVLDNSAEKKHIKALNTTIESLELKCDDLQSTVDELRLQIDVLKRKSRRTSDVPALTVNKENIVTLRHVQINKEDTRPVSPYSSAAHTEKTECLSNSDQMKLLTSESPTKKENSVSESQCHEDKNQNIDEPDSGMEQMYQLITQLRETRSQRSRDERMISELEEQLATLVQQNQALENQVIQLHHREDDMNMKSMHEELTTLEEVRQGQMCSRCLRTMDQSGSEVPDDDDTSMLEELMTSQHRSSFTMDVQESTESQSTPTQQQKSTSNPYKELVEKYEALVEVHRAPTTARSTKSDQCLSLQEELAMSGDFNTLSTKDTDEESGHGDSLHTEKQSKTSRKTFSTPTDFSETETSSSGFADETSNKFTQTEGRVGSFLCTIADGKDCKFSIYDDASPIDSRFRDKPEYRILFKEIFKVLKKAAENKDEGEPLPLLDDHTPVKTAPSNANPVTPCNEQLPEFLDDDSQSVLSSTMSELSVSQNETTTIIEQIIESQNQPIPEASVDQQQQASSGNGKHEHVLKPLVRQPLEYLSVEVRRRSASKRKIKQAEQRSNSPVTHIIGSPKINYASRPNSGRKRKEIKTLPLEIENPTWNGSTLQFWSTNRKNVASPTPSQGSSKACFEFKPSTASQDLHKLKRLDLSYAEVLRNADSKKREMMRQRRK